MDNQESLKNEIQSIYDLFLVRDKYAESTPFDKGSTENIQTKKAFRYYIIFPVIIVVAILSLIFVLYRPDLNSSLVEQLTKYGLLAAYFTAILLFLRKAYKDNPDIADFFQNPLRIFFDGLNYTADCDTILVIGLERYSEKALIFVKDRMEMQLSAIQHRFGSMTGSLTKIGILPGLLALLAATYELPGQVFLYGFSTFFLTVYIGSFWVQHSLPRINFYIRILESELTCRNNK